MKNRQSRLFDRKRRKIIGVVHLRPLPGSPAFHVTAKTRKEPEAINASGSASPAVDSGPGPIHDSFDSVYSAAAHDAQALCRGGVDALIVENFGDAPFFPGRVEPHTVAIMTSVIDRLSPLVDIPIGVNVLRNDGMAALGIALATRAAFVRVNVFVGATVTDQGIIEGRAHELLRYRNALQSDTRILADVHVKHGRPLGNGPIEEAARDAWHRGRADGIIVTGSATGAFTDVGDLRKVREALPDAFLLAGSGVTTERAPDILRIADAAIVGTSLKRDGEVHAPVDQDRVSELMDAVRSI